MGYSAGYDEEYCDPPKRDTSPWVICPSCSGNGTHVNPSIDANGITAEEFHADPEFEEMYMSGAFDVPCRHCNRTGKVRESYLDKMADDAEERRMRALEDGDWESYQGASDPRW